MPSLEVLHWQQHLSSYLRWKSDNRKRISFLILLNYWKVIGYVEKTSTRSPWLFCPLPLVTDTVQNSRILHIVNWEPAAVRLVSSKLSQTGLPIYRQEPTRADKKWQEPTRSDQMWQEGHRRIYWHILCNILHITSYYIFLHLTPPPPRHFMDFLFVNRYSTGSRYILDFFFLARCLILGLNLFSGSILHVCEQQKLWFKLLQMRERERMKERKRGMEGERINNRINYWKLGIKIDK